MSSTLLLFSLRRFLFFCMSDDIPLIDFRFLHPPSLLLLLRPPFSLFSLRYSRTPLKWELDEWKIPLKVDSFRERVGEAAP